ncbi:hypothetical protein [Sphingobacterium mizutaii]|uniref:hypothetical protein n=1 Tax=Sphingobacterium mizutaii TaxID=1010 RepID=UPI001625E1E9|nr:hypothetical protein [Sphingobacterium mizutaii]
MKKLNLKGMNYFEGLLDRTSIGEHPPAEASAEQGDLVAEIAARTDRFLAKIRRSALDRPLDEGFSRNINALYARASALMDRAASERSTGRAGTGDIAAEVLGSMGSILENLESAYPGILGPELALGKGSRLRKLPELRERFLQLREDIPEGEIGEAFAKKVMDFTQVDRKPSFPLTRRSVTYMEELLRRLGDWDPLHQSGHFTALESFLVYVNFNSKRCMDLILSRIRSRLGEECRGAKETLLALLDIQRDFAQLHRKEDLWLNPGYLSVGSFVESFLESEINFCSGAIRAVGEDGIPNGFRKRNVNKLTCNLSADQIAIILRLLDEERVVDARSLSQVYSTIVPFLSTPDRTSLSPGSLRSKSYHPEERDLSKVIGTLQGLLERAGRY